MFLFSLVVVTLVLIFNLWLTYALLRRIRTVKASRIAKHSAPLPERGSKLNNFSITDSQGGRLTRRDIDSGRFFAIFLHPESVEPEKVRPTLELLAAEDAPVFIALVAHRLADPAVADFVPLLPPRARIFEAAAAEELAAAMGVRAFPTTIRLADGVIDGAGSLLAAHAPTAAEH